MERTINLVPQARPLLSCLLELRFVLINQARVVMSIMSLTHGTHQRMIENMSLHIHYARLIKIADCANQLKV